MRDEAALWVARLSDPACNPAVRAAFEAWRDADPAREAAFEREAATWEALDRLRALRPAFPVPDPDLLAPKRVLGPRRSIQWAPAVGMLLTAVLVGALALNALSTSAYATAVGERRLIVLPDGSRVELNTDSRIVVHFDRGVRRVDLVRGEAVFNIGAEGRPFIVHTAAGDFQTRRSDMAVRLRSAGATLIVRQGVVNLKSEANMPQVRPLASIKAGDQLDLAGGHVNRLSIAPEAVDRALAWRQGYIALNGQTLSEAVEEFNRYNTTKLIISDEHIAGLRLAGYFSATDEEGFAVAVAHAFPVKSARGSDGAILLSRKN